MLSLLVTASLFAASVSAHGYVSSVRLDGVDVTGWLPYNDPYTNPPPQRIVRKFSDNGPIEQVGDLSIVCNRFGANTNQPVSGHAPVTAGSDVVFSWTEWPSSHIGPVMTYLANCNGDCSTFSGANSPVWFKIDEEGLLPDGSWAADKVVRTGKWTTRIPSDLVAGKYLMRHEILALHSAQSPQGAQFYPSCFQLDLKSNGNAVPRDLVSFPGAYKETDPGILFNVHYPRPTSYTIPGPRPYKEGTGSTTGVPPPEPATSSSSTSSSAPVTSSSAATCASPKGAWDQCGGRDYRGSTCCISGYSCVYNNDWYSQCIPTPRQTSSTSPSVPSSSSSSSSSVRSSSSSSSSSSSVVSPSASTCNNPGATVTVTQVVSATPSAGRYAAYNKCVALAALNASDNSPVELSSCSVEGLKKRHLKNRHF